MATPQQIEVHAHKYKEGAWRNYSLVELAQWVELLTKRASHRTNYKKCIKDLDDASNYLSMLNAKFQEDTDKIDKSFRQEE